MTGPRFAESARAYWAALGRKDALPELPEEPLDAFIELLDVGRDDDHAFELLEFSVHPYPGLVLGDPRRPYAMQWALELAELEPFVHKQDRGLTLLADAHPDGQGRHRVYSFEDGIRGLLEFADLPDALAWMAAKVVASRSGAALDDAAGARATTLDDGWEDAATSGMHVMESLLDAPFVEAYDAFSRGEWPAVDPTVPSFRLKRQGPWQRGLALYLVRRFLAQRIVDVPRSLKPAELGKPLRALVETLNAFAEAIPAGMVPEPIDSLVDADDPELRRRARTWVDRFEANRAASKPSGAAGDGDFEDFDDDHDPAADDALAAVLAKVLGGKGGAKAGAAGGKPAGRGAAAALAGAAAKGAARAAPVEEPPEEVRDTPFLRSLRTALAGALDAMVKAELLDVADAKRPLLLEELVEAGANARSAAHLLKSLTETLVESDHVDEVYATDEQVERFIRGRLEAR